MNVPKPFDTYNGGKGGSGVAQWIINQMPPHQVYIEPFLGNGTVLRLKRPAACSLGIDADAGVIASWAACRAADAIPGCSVRQGNGVRFLQDYAFTGGELVYCDPPYLLSSRSSGEMYLCELYEAEHVELLATIKALSCAVMISGYWSSLYNRELTAWRRLSFRTVKRSGRPAVEYLWCNFPVPAELHDYRFVGEDYRERQRIRRKLGRWTKRLMALPDHERLCLLDALQASVRACDRPGSSVDDGVGPGQSVMALRPAGPVRYEFGGPGTHVMVDDGRGAGSHLER